jgi:hypothetical protein
MSLSISASLKNLTEAGQKNFEMEELDGFVLTNPEECKRSDINQMENVNYN